MPEELTDEEKALLEKHRASKRTPRKVTVRGKADDGTEYSFDLEGDEAEHVVSRHKSLFTPADPGTADTTGGDKKPGGKYFGQK